MWPVVYISCSVILNTVLHTFHKSNDDMYLHKMWSDLYNISNIGANRSQVTFWYFECDPQHVLRGSRCSQRVFGFLIKVYYIVHSIPSHLLRHLQCLSYLTKMVAVISVLNNDKNPNRAAATYNWVCINALRYLLYKNTWTRYNGLFWMFLSSLRHMCG